jgi:hypothetical protein
MIDYQSDHFVSHGIIATIIEQKQNAMKNVYGMSHKLGRKRQRLEAVAFFLEGL